MSLKVAVQMDPIDAINIDADSTFVMMMQAQEYGHSLYYYRPQDLALEGDRVTANAWPVTVRYDHDDFYTLGQRTIIDLRDMDVVLLRQDPPFDMQYLTTTYLLEKVHPDTLVVNNPAEVRSNPEKLYPACFPDLIPPSLITHDVSRIKAFRDTHKDIIIKPLFGNGGAGVFHLKPDDENFSALLETMFATSREPLQVQAYLPDIRQGDKRIILIDGEPAGVINRIPPEGDARANMHAGGKAEASELSPRDQEICDAIGPDLKARGLVFTGIDVIGGWLTEINVTSPTGLQEINRFDDTNLQDKLWQAIHARIKSA